MKPRIQLWFLMSIVGILPIHAWASCSESNSDPNYIKKVIMRSTIVCGGYYSTTFTCEHYLSVGQSMEYLDYQPGPDCYYTYTTESCTWIPLEVDSSWVPAYARLSADTGMRGFGFVPPTEKNRTEMRDILRNKLGFPTLGDDVNTKGYLDSGSSGLPYLAMMRKFKNTWGQNITWRETDANRDLPEMTTSDFDNSVLGMLRAYPTLDAAIVAASACDQETTRPVIFCKIGVWSEQVAHEPPTPFTSPGIEGQIPLYSVDAPNGVNDFKYFTLIDGKWYTLSHAVALAPNTPQKGQIIEVGEPVAGNGEAIIFFKRCVPKHQW